MSDTMKARLARAIVASLDADAIVGGNEYRGRIDADGELVIDASVSLPVLVKAILVVMRDPTISMMNTGGAKVQYGALHAEEVWQAMIDDALAEEPVK